MQRVKPTLIATTAAAFLLATPPAHAELFSRISTAKTYLQNGSTVNFTGGTYDMFLRDGNFIYLDGCEFPEFFNRDPQDVAAPRPCTTAANGFTISNFELGSFYTITNVIPALVIEPNRADKPSLRSAPASTLPRPQGNFTNFSYSVFYDLSSGFITQYPISIYSTQRTYSASQRSKIDSDIVPGVYNYTFPQLNNPNTPVPIAAVIYPIPEGYAKVQNQLTGFRFLTPGKWFNGFLKLNPNKLNVVKWEGLTRTKVFASDRLYISFKELAVPGDASKGPDLGPDAIFFPALGTEPVIRTEIQLPNPYVTEYTIPPLLEFFPFGKEAIVELRLQRFVTTNGVIYDASSRLYQQPIRFSATY